MNSLEYIPTLDKGATLGKLDTSLMGPEFDLRLMQYPIKKASQSQPPTVIDDLCVTEYPCIPPFATEGEDMVGRVLVASDAVSDNPNGQEGQDNRKKKGFLKSQISRKVRPPIVSTAMWAWNLYLRIAMASVKGARAVTWPISHLL